MLLVTSLVLFETIPTLARAQTDDAPVTTADAMLALPDAPGLSSSSVPDGSSSEAASFRFDPAGPSSDPATIHKYVQPGTVAPSLSPADKVLLGFRSAMYPIPALGWLFSSGYSQAINSVPNYGTNGKAYAQRLGAAAARNVSEGVISDSVMATVLHEDPRYYRLGTGHPFFNRLGHAVEHAVVTRKDNGDATVNYALISGNLIGSAITNAYYPQRNRGFGQTMETFALSLSGSALGFTVAEFYSDALEMVHLKKAQ
jgi:hypothetical protein